MFVVNENTNKFSFLNEMLHLDEFVVDSVE